MINEHLGSGEKIG